MIRNLATGQLRWREASGAPVRDAEGRIIGAVAVARDITERKRAEEALRSQRELLEVVFQHMPAAINLIRGRDLRILMVNPGYRALAPGKTEFVGKTLDEIWPETGRDFSTLCRRVFETGEPHHAVDDRVTIQRQPGGPLEEAYFTWSLYRVRLPGNEGWGIFNPAWETTARVQAEEALAAAHRQTQSLIDNTTAMVYACDLEERFVLANAALAALLRTTPAQLLGKRRHEFMPQADADAHEAADREVIAAGRAVEFEEHSDLHGRSITWLSTKFPLRDAQGRIYAVAGIVTDISERKQAEEALRESESFYRQTLESIPGMVFTTRPDGYCDYQSQQWVDYTGVPMAEHLGDGWNKLLHPDDRPRSFAAWNAAVRGQGALRPRIPRPPPRRCLRMVQGHRPAHPRRRRPDRALVRRGAEHPGHQGRRGGHQNLVDREGGVAEGNPSPREE